MKQDAVPGITTQRPRHADEGRHVHRSSAPSSAGSATRSCARRRVVLSQADYEKWVADAEGQGARAGGVGGGQDALHPAMRLAATRSRTRARRARSGRISIRCSPGRTPTSSTSRSSNPNAEIAPGFQPDVMPGNFGDSLTDAQLDEPRRVPREDCGEELMARRGPEDTSTPSRARAAPPQAQAAPPPDDGPAGSARSG